MIKDYTQELNGRSKNGLNVCKKNYRRNNGISRCIDADQNID